MLVRSTHYNFDGPDLCPRSVSTLVRKYAEQTNSFFDNTELNLKFSEPSTLVRSMHYNFDGPEF